MKVIENNNFIEVECPHCKSKLGVHLSDIVYNEMAHHSPTFSVSCGACGKTVGITSSAMPSGWASMLADD